MSRPLKPDDDKFLDALERANFLFFWEQANPQTGLIKDRSNVRANDTSVAASIASTGFGLTAICIAEKRGYIGHADARLRVIATLSFIWHKLPTHRGFFYHFATPRSPTPTRARPASSPSRAASPSRPRTTPARPTASPAPRSSSWPAALRCPPPSASASRAPTPRSASW